MIKKYIAMILLVMAIGSTCYWMGYQDGSRGRLDDRVAITAKIASTEELLTKWVYSKSIKISVGTARQIVKEAMKTDKPLLTLALISIESEFCPSATSSAGAIGLSQIMYNYHGKALIEAKIIKEKRDLYNVADSIKAGSFILNGFLKQTNGDLSKALEKYLGGANTWYVNRILANLGSLYILDGGY